MKKLIVCNFDEWAKKLITLSRFKDIEYFIDDENICAESEGKIECLGIEKKIYPIEKLYNENLNEIIIIIGDSHLYSYYKNKLEMIGLQENFHFFNGWKLTQQFYFNFYENNTWEKLEDSHEEIFINEKIYEYRAMAVAKLLPPEVHSIMDLGCGDEVLKKYIRDGIEYIAVDYKKRNESTIVCDLNKDILPDMAVDMYCLVGVIYFLENIQNLISQMGKAKYVLVTFRGREHYLRFDGRFDGIYSGCIRNSLYTADLINLFFKNNFILINWVRGYAMEEILCDEDIFIFRKK